MGKLAEGESSLTRTGWMQGLIPTLYWNYLHAVVLGFVDCVCMQMA